MNKLNMGVYKHYKGHLYQVLGIAHDANYEDRICVVYIGLELDNAHLGPRLAVRTIENFLEWVGLDGTVVKPEPLSFTEKEAARTEGLRPRFDYLGIELTGDMLVGR